MEEPELVTLIPEEEPEETPPASKLGKRLVIQIVVVVCLKVATGIVLKNMTKTVQEMDLLYPESVSRIRWKD